MTTSLKNSIVGPPLTGVATSGFESLDWSDVVTVLTEEPFYGPIVLGYLAGRVTVSKVTDAATNEGSVENAACGVFWTEVGSCCTT